MNLLILLAVGLVLAYRITVPEDRKRYAEMVLAYGRELKGAATAPRPDLDRFRRALRARMRYVVVTPAIVAIQVVVAGGMIAGASAMSDPATLVQWGANLGPRTTNGEWWRLASAAFVHSGALQLLVDAFVLMQLGAVVERIAGRTVFALVYVSAGAFGGLTYLSAHPVNAGLAPSASIFGVYGLLLACVMWQLVSGRREASPALEGGASPALENGAPPPPEETPSREPVFIPRIAVKRLGLVAALFLVSSAMSGLAGGAELTGLFTGVAFGLVLGREMATQAPTIRWASIGAAAAAVLGLACALPLRNIADVKPALEHVIETEERTATAYKSSFDRYKKGRLSADALADVAERAIVPELQAADARLAALVHVPAEHQELVADAREFLRLRCASWRARAEAVRRTNKDLRQLPVAGADAGWRIKAEARFRSNMAATGNAESAERASLEAFERVRRGAPGAPD